ncbi:hypothetical protein BGZ61DRAFT_525120 [Ilyonectria robusta]|uniref:uncharacterized protein n=1 Tax=Ilyonectria robusta TaxID=1079257 RepID=UPI001E8D455F|nr:uncharacterized protein BGZ61DRAFT_525120 [Ilyonectria robusta]KAH8736901.1 hypothetical protein BGZ61DRAFT_525120 [Ilyonectria robusta]
MRYSSRPLLLLAAAGLTSAKPYPRDSFHDAGFSYLMPRACDSYCGADNQYCCNSDEVCTTLDSVATCIAEGSYVGAITTTWTETKTYTSTVMTLWDAAPEATAGVDCVPQNSAQEACGTICCAGWQTCAFTGQCSAKSGMEDGTTVVITSNGKVTTQYSAPYRVTGTTTITSEGVRSDTVSETATASTSTATSDSDTIGAGGGTGSNLSGGAIAGIVIGSIAGVALLLLLCFCCIVRGLWVAIFGKKKDESRERVDIVEERYSRHGSRPATVHSRRDSHKGWFGGGGGPSSAGSRREKKKESSGKKWLGIAGLAATLLALLNLRKDKKPASKGSRSSRGSSRYSDSYYSYSDYTSPSSSSSGGRTQRTRRTRDSRASRASRARSYSNSERP